MTIKVQIACDHDIIRKSLAALLDSDHEFDVVYTSPEALRGLEAVRRIDADVVLLAVPPGEDVAQHTEWYLDAANGAGVVGFSVIREQADGYRKAGIDEIIYSHDSAAELSRAIRRAAELRSR